MSRGNDDVDRLYDLPLERFVGRRNELARELRARGERERAAEVAKLPKPSLPAWAANQVLRSQPKTARELLESGRTLTKVQQSALRGRSVPATLRDAIERHRSAMAEAMRAARGLLDADGRGLSKPVLERVHRTLSAASLDPVLAEQASSMRLESEHFYGGFDELEPGRRRAPSPPRHTRGTVPRSPAPIRTTAGTGADDGARRRAAARLKAARHRSAEATKAVRAATKTKDAAERAQARAAEAYERALRSLERATEAQRLAQEAVSSLESGRDR